MATANIQTNLQPRPPKPSGRLTATIKLCLVLGLLAAGLGAAWLITEYQAFQRTSLSVPASGLVYSVSPGTSLQGLAADLKQRGILRRAAKRGKALPPRLHMALTHRAEVDTPDEGARTT